VSIEDVCHNLAETANVWLKSNGRADSFRAAAIATYGNAERQKSKEQADLRSRELEKLSGQAERHAAKSRLSF
jgi:hypothetical protein